MGITSEFRARTLAAQARRWTADELAAALAGLVELDAMVKGAPGFEADAAQRRLAFTLWVRDHADAERRSRLTRGTCSLGGRQSAEDQACSWTTRSLSMAKTQRPSPRSSSSIRSGIDVQLRAVLAQPAGDAEAQPLAPVGQPERRVEPGRDEPVTTGGATVSRNGHATGRLVDPMTQGSSRVPMLGGTARCAS